MDSWTFPAFGRFLSGSRAFCRANENFMHSVIHSGSLFAEVGINRYAGTTVFLDSTAVVQFRDAGKVKYGQPNYLEED